MRFLVAYIFYKVNGRRQYKGWGLEEVREIVDHRFKRQVPLVGLKEPPISLSFKHVFVVLGLRKMGLWLRIEGYQILVSV